MCLHNFYYFFLAGDTDQNGKLNYDESISVFTVANWVSGSCRSFVRAYDVTVAQNGIDFEHSSREDLLQCIISLE